MNRRSFLGAMAATASGLLILDDERKRVYSFIRRPHSNALQLLDEDAVVLADMQFAGHGFIDHCAERTGTASWVRYRDGLGREVSFPLDDSGKGFSLNTRMISSGAIVSCSSFTIVSDC